MRFTRTNYLFHTEEAPINDNGDRIPYLTLPLTLEPSLIEYFHESDVLLVAFGTWWHPGKLFEPVTQATAVRLVFPRSFESTSFRRVFLTMGMLEWRQDDPMMRQQTPNVDQRNGARMDPASITEGAKRFYQYNMEEQFLTLISVYGDALRTLLSTLRDQFPALYKKVRWRARHSALSILLALLYEATKPPCVFSRRGLQTLVGGIVPYHNECNAFDGPSASAQIGFGKSTEWCQPKTNEKCRQVLQVTLTTINEPTSQPVQKKERGAVKKINFLFGGVGWGGK